MKGMDEATKFQYQGSAIQEDMVEFLDEYSFIEPAKGFRRELKKEPFQSARGGKSVLTQKEKNNPIFLTKTDEIKLNRSRLRGGRIPKELLDNILQDE